MKTFFLSILFFTLGSVSFSQNAWFQQSSGITSNLRSIYFVDQNNGWAAGDSGKILHTTNGGNNWNAQFSNTIISLSGIIFSDANSGIAVGNYNDGNPWCQYTVIILSTTNGGAGWTIVQNGYGGKATDLSKINSNLYSAFSGRDFQCIGTLGSVGKTTNSGVNWSYFNNTNGGFAYTSVSFIDTLTGWASGEYFSDVLPGLKQIIRTTDGGTDWTLIRRDTIFGSYIPNIKLRFNNFTTGFMFNRSLVKTTNSGLNWQQTDSLSTIGKSDYFFINPDTGWCIGTGGTIIRTNNGGTNWSPQISNVINSLASICFVNENVGYIAGNNGVILKTITGGLTYVNQSSSITPSDFILNQNFPNPFNPKTIINYELGIASNVKLKVFDSQGKEIETLINEKQNAGRYEVDFNGENLSSGIYFYSLFADGEMIATKRMILLK